MRGALVLKAGVVGLALLAAGCGRPGLKVTEDAAPLTTVPLPTTTTTTLPAHPGCPAPAGPTDDTLTTLATPVAQNLPYAATPGGPAVGRVTEHWGGPATRPVVGETAGWVQIRLETRPNGSAGWLPAADVTLNTTPYSIVVSICNHSLTLYEGTTAAYTAPVGVGEARWPTPQGPSFVDSIVATPRSQLYVYGPTVLILGSHSNYFATFDGGDGTVAIHGYPSDPGSTAGVASSHGCVRANPATINTIKQSLSAPRSTSSPDLTDLQRLRINGGVTRSLTVW